MATAIAPTSAPEGHRPASPADSDKTVVASSENAMSNPRPRRALFSTGLGSRPPRVVQGPPYPPIIVRSVKVTGVVDAARLWREKYPREALSIFPDCGRTIGEFWDPADIHIDTPEHYQDVLNFLMADNVHCAKKFAVDWSRANPEQLSNTIGRANLKDIYDPANPGAIVDKVFVNGETNAWPHQFLFFAACIMRQTMLDMEKEKKLMQAKSTTASTEPTSAEQRHSISGNYGPAATSSGEPLVVDGSSMVKGKKPSAAAHHPVPAPVVPSRVPSKQHFVAPPNGRVPSNGQPHPGFQQPHPGFQNAQPMGHIMGGMPSNFVPSPTMNAPLPHMPHGGRPGYGAPPHPSRLGSHGENFPRVISGGYPTQPPSGPMSNMHTPHLNHASMAMGQPAMGPANPPQHYPQGYPPMSPATYAAAQLHQPGIGHPGMVPSQMMQMGPNMPPSYLQQIPNDHAPRGMPIGDLTNHMQYSNRLPYSMGTQKHGNRRNSSYGNGSGVLYDPYSGANPAFNDTNTGRKTSRGSYHNYSDRPHRKSSATDQRPRTGSYGYDRVDGGDNRHVKPRMIDDPAVLSDKLRGCGENWIGAENTTVDELYVSDLLEDVHERDVSELFRNHVGITPTKVLLKSSSFNTTRPYIHAFVSFATASDIKKALHVGTLNPQIRNVSVRVIVPRRFFQKAADSTNHYEPPRQDKQPIEGRNLRGTARMTSHDQGTFVASPDEQDNKQLYSPQDVRSALPRKTSRQGSEVGLASASGGSPELRKATTRKSSPTKKPIFDRESFIPEEAIAADDAEPVVGPNSAGVIQDNHKATATTAEQSVDVIAETTESSSTSAPTTEEATSAQNTIQPAVNVTDADVATSFSRSPVREVAPKPEQPDSQTKEVLKDTETVESVVKIPAASAGSASVEQSSAEAVTTEDKSDKDAAEIQTDSSPRKEIAVDDEAEPDSSFLSAQEDIVEPDPSLGPAAELGSVDQGTAAVNHCTAKEEVYENSAASSTPASEKTFLPQRSATSVLEKDDTAARTASTDPSAKDSEGTQAETPGTAEVSQETGKATQDITESAQDAAEATQDLTVPADNTATMPTTSKQSAMDAIKKSGPQQTPSLNPFAKKTKAQREKEKAQTRKDKKRREQEEKAAKAKSGKTVPHVGLQEQASSTEQSLEAQANPVGSPNADTSTNDHVQSEKNKVPTDQALEEGEATGEGSAVAVIPPQASKIEGDEDVSGKQTGGTTTTIPDKTGSVTHKTEVGQKAGPTEEMPTANAPLPTAQSPERNGGTKPEPSGDSESPTSAVNANDPAAPANNTAVNANDASTPPNNKKAPPALPHLNLDPSSTSNTSSQSSSSTPAAPAPSAPVSDMSPSRRGSNATSGASSATLNAGDTGLTSPSPSAENFFTPLQTPAVPPTPEEQTPKPKKKKPKKKKKKPAAAGEASASSMPPFTPGGAPRAPNDGSPPSSNSDDGLAYDDNPFGNQISHIDAIRGATKDPNNYYNIVNREMEEEKAEKELAQEHEQVPADMPKGIWRQLQGFVKENPGAFDHLR